MLCCKPVGTLYGGGACIRDGLTEKQNWKLIFQNIEIKLFNTSVLKNWYR